MAIAQVSRVPLTASSVLDGLYSPAQQMTADADSQRAKSVSNSLSFQEVALPHLDAAYNLARWLMRDRAAAEDLVQDAMLRALKYFPSFRGTNARGWLLRILRNTAYAAHSARRETPLTSTSTQSIEDDEIPLPDIADTESNPETMISKAQDSAHLDDLLAELPMELRECIVLRALEDLSYREIADITEVPIGTVMSRLWRARQWLMRAARRTGP